MVKLTGRPSLEVRASHEAHVLDIAFKEFLDNGFKGTSLDAIARRAGVSRVTLYRRYKDKVGLFIAVGAHAVERLRFDEQHIVTHRREPHAVLTDLLKTAYDAATTIEATAIVRMAIAERDSFPELARAVRASRIEFLQPLTDYLEALDQDNVIVLDAPPSEAAEQLMDLCLSTYIVMLTEPLKTAQERSEAARHAAVFFLKAKRPESPGF